MTGQDLDRILDIFMEMFYTKRVFFQYNTNWSCCPLIFLYSILTDTDSTDLISESYSKDFNYFALLVT